MYGNGYATRVTTDIEKGYKKISLTIADLQPPDAMYNYICDARTSDEYSVNMKENRAWIMLCGKWL